MESIDLFEQDVATTTISEETKQNSSASSGTPSSPAFATPNNSEPLRLPRTSGSGRVQFLRDTIKSQIPKNEQLQEAKRQAGRALTGLGNKLGKSPQLPTNEQLQETKRQAGRALKGLGNKLSKINLGNLIDKMEEDQGLAKSLELLNSRMKEEVERQEVRRESEQLTLKVITDHLNEFLTENPLGTFEEWIEDLHPENANQGELLRDIQQIDERFYVMESDHRRLWNEAIEKQAKSGDKSSYAHRLVEARTQIWGKVSTTNTNSPAQNNNSGYSDTQTIDLLGDIDTFQSSGTTPENLKDNGIEEIDFFAPTTQPTTDILNASGNACLGTENSKKDDPFQDLIQF